ncbi:MULTISPECIES: DUF805 domain-containing protein [Streptomyces]|uniref:DUF805 domain-containing protein n=1 Tax=Streptomyces albireticuli TaxID=1940 RepID=A0A2A2DGH5_9ACTN|nr:MULTISPECIES: DUF805 domain-containing protein [Streptomyces]MCD9195054.1 DUF805 domain-containing protein [Streptomyces albireticuli]PAU50625.1 DUF805 domain-containing protein [Streptomyces albireticuli]UQI45281.1 DUF805 domain-containing protein [Streptomyces sp. HU2014]
MHWYVDVLKKYATFSGRAGRPEFWMFTLINVIISIVLAVLDVVFGTDPLLGTVYSLAVFLPGLAVGTRRLHDTDRSGWWQLIILIPIVGLIVLLVFWAGAGKPHANAYGPSPQEVPAH